MPRRKVKDFKISKAKVKYPITDNNNQMKNKQATVNLWIEHIPIFGWIHRRKYGSWNVKFPENYT